MATVVDAFASSVQRVFAALENPSYRWRTVPGIAEETGLSASDVRQVLADLPAREMVRTQSRKGWVYTTRRHYDATKTWKSRILSVLSDRPK